MFRHWTAMVMVLLLGAAAFVRVYGAHDALVAYNDTRQLHSAIIARAKYYEWVKPKTDPLRIDAAEERSRVGQLEAPIVPAIAALGYMLSGGENMVIPRLFGAVCWLVGGIFMYLCASWFLSPGPALIAAAYFLLLPYTVVASQAFQPDPLMMMLAVASFFFIVRDDYELTFGSTMIAGAWAGMAILVKPASAPMIASLYVALGLRRDGIIGLLRSPETYMMALFALAPSALYYAPELILDARLRADVQKLFQPALVQTPEFWFGVRDQLFRVAYGPYVPAVAALSLLIAPNSRVRWALWGLTLGYVAYVVACSYYAATLDGPHVLVLPIVALGLAALGSRVWLWMPRMVRPVLGVAVAAGAVWVAYWGAREIQESAWPRTQGLGGEDRRL